MERRSSLTQALASLALVTAFATSVPAARAAGSDAPDAGTGKPAMGRQDRDTPADGRGGSMPRYGFSRANRQDRDTPTDGRGRAEADDALPPDQGPGSNARGIEKTDTRRPMVIATPPKP